MSDIVERLKATLGAGEQMSETYSFSTGISGHDLRAAIDEIAKLRGVRERLNEEIDYLVRQNRVLAALGTVETQSLIRQVEAVEKFCDRCESDEIKWSEFGPYDLRDAMNKAAVNVAQNPVG